MKKIVLIAVLLAAAAVAGRAQESRQDVSISSTAIIQPYVYASTTVGVDSNRAFGALASYRFMMTPSSAIEGNFGMDYQSNIHYSSPALLQNGINVNTRIFEYSAAYVRSMTFKRFTPFLEVGPAVLHLLPVIDMETTSHDVKSQTLIAGLYGGGVAYEISPSFDIRAEFRGFVTKVPDFGLSGGTSSSSLENLSTNKYYNIYVPTLGVAYHF